MAQGIVYGYMFDCHEFEYNNRHITGLCCEIKMNLDALTEELNAVAIQISKTDGFTILLNSRATSVIVQPYKIYALALCENHEEEPIEIDDDVLNKFSNYIIEDINGSAESSWLIDES